ncbi:MAG: patatin-like phospholipase family protein [Acetobacteraceae bacterium]|jgi:hypothetical protein|nr:patatin-like phospholipase family protein [Acetobacteraceae bacterium]
MTVRFGRGSRRGFLAGASLTTLGLATGCATPERLPPVPRPETQQATVLGVPNERFYYLTDAAAVDAEFRAAGEREIRRLGIRPGGALPVSNLLAVSGGGENGAFGAGLINGWTVSGQRPVFNLVTGVSTGALTAPFAYLGPAYDAQLRSVYTDITIQDVAISRGLITGALADALADTAPLLTTISRYLDETMLAAIAAAYDSGRLLLIGTTNLDAQTPVVWNIGAIAKSGHPGALDLIRKVLLASAAIPGAFPPVMIDVTVNGRSYQEMHVDGGAFAQAFLYPQAVGEGRTARRMRGERVREVHAWVIRNARLDPEWSAVQRRTFGIASRAISTMIFTSGFNDVLRLYNRTQADGVDFNLAFIGSDFDKMPPEPFDQAFMRALFDYGFEQGRAGGRWAKRPPLGTAT